MFFDLLFIVIVLLKLAMGVVSLFQTQLLLRSETIPLKWSWIDCSQFFVLILFLILKVLLDVLQLLTIRCTLALLFVFFLINFFSLGYIFHFMIIPLPVFLQKLLFKVVLVNFIIIDNFLLDLLLQVGNLRQVQLLLVEASFFLWTLELHFLLLLVLFLKKPLHPMSGPASDFQDFKIRCEVWVALA